MVEAILCPIPTVVNSKSFNTLQILLKYLSFYFVVILPCKSQAVYRKHICVPFPAVCSIFTKPALKAGKHCKLYVTILHYRENPHILLFLIRYLTKKGELLNLETKHHSLSVEPLSKRHTCQFYWAPDKRSTACPETIGCSNTNTEYRKGSSRAWYIRIFMSGTLHQRGITLSKWSGLVGHWHPMGNGNSVLCLGKGLCWVIWK